MKEETIFKVGDLVYCYIHGWGKVVKINDKSHKYPIVVRFKDMDFSYTTEGSPFEDAVSPTLSFSEYTLEGFTQTRPLKEFDAVFYKIDQDSPWQIGHYYKMMNGHHWVYAKQDKTPNYYQKIKYMTTENPLIK